VGKSLVFLQARMGSHRLPGKVLMEIRGCSILGRAIQRLQAAKIDGVVVLTTRRVQDDRVVQEAKKYGADSYRGPELDVLRRFQEAAQQYQPDIVIRATADNPLVDIDSVNRIVEATKIQRWDWCMERDLPVGAATETITMEALKRVDQIATRPDHREHVTLYIKENPSEFRMGLLNPPEWLKRPEVRLTVDSQEDFQRMTELIERGPADFLSPLRQYLPLI